MDPLRLICDELGFFTRAHARDLEYDDRAMAYAVRNRIWHRIRRGYYTFPDLWFEADPVHQHRIRARAVLDSLGDAVALSHVSGVVAHGLDVWGLDLDRIHVTRLDGGAGRIEGDVVHHTGLATSCDVGEVDGLRVLSPARCALEAGTLGTPESGLVILDSGLHRGAFSHTELGNQFDRMSQWPRMRQLRIPVAMSSEKSESVGESRGRWLFWTQRLPAPVLQYEVWLRGRLLGRSDWGWPVGRLLGEFDGRIKYGPLLKTGQQSGDAVFEEKRREDALREATGFSMIRLTWADLGTPGPTAARIRRLLQRAG